MRHQYINERAKEDNGAGSMTKLISLKAPGPDSFCPPFKKDAGFIERITLVDGTGEDCLLLRSVCAIESTAIANPEIPIYVYMNDLNKTRGPEIARQRPGKVRSCNVMAILQNFQNVYLLRKKFRELYLNNSIWSEVLYNSGQPSNRVLTNVVKMTLLKMYGGLVLDSDIISFRPLHCLQNSLVSLPSLKGISSNLISFDRNHTFISYLIRSAIFFFREDNSLSFDWPAVTRAFKTFCATENISTGHYTCHKNQPVHLISESAIYPIKPTEWIRFFFHAFDVKETKLEESFMANVHASEWGVRNPETSLYSSLARYYCPATWNSANKAGLTNYF